MTDKADEYTIKLTLANLSRTTIPKRFMKQWSAEKVMTTPSSAHLTGFFNDAIKRLKKHAMDIGLTPEKPSKLNISHTSDNRHPLQLRFIFNRALQAILHKKIPHETVRCGGNIIGCDMQIEGFDLLNYSGSADLVLSTIPKTISTRGSWVSEHFKQNPNIDTEGTIAVLETPEQIENLLFGDASAQEIHEENLRRVEKLWKSKFKEHEKQAVKTLDRLAALIPKLDVP